MDELELRHAEAHYAEMPRDGYSGRCEMLLPEDLRGMRVLDLGCRNGKGACKLADRVGPDGFVLGVDPSAACVARAEATACGRRPFAGRRSTLSRSSAILTRIQRGSYANLARNQRRSNAFSMRFPRLVTPGKQHRLPVDEAESPMLFFTSWISI